MSSYHAVLGCSIPMGKIAAHMGMLPTLNFGDACEEVLNGLSVCHAQLISTITISIRKGAMSLLTYPKKANPEQIEVKNLHFKVVDRVIDNENTSETLVINRVELPLEHLGLAYEMNSDSAAQVIHDLSKRFVTIYRPHEIIVRVERTEHNDVLEIASWPRFCDGKTKAIDFSVAGEMTEAEVRALLRMVKAKQQLTLSMSCAPFTSDGSMPGFAHDSIYFLGEAKWFDANLLLRTKVRTMVIEHPNFSMAGLNAYLRAWADGEQEKLESFKMHFHEAIWEAETNELLKGLDATPAPEEEASEDNPFTGEGWQLTSRTGKFATIEKSPNHQQQGVIVINFAAANDAFPRIEREPYIYW